MSHEIVSVLLLIFISVSANADTQNSFEINKDQLTSSQITINAVDKALTPSSNSQISAEKKQELLHLLKHDCGSCHGMTLAGGLGPELSPNSLNRLNIDQVAITILNGRPGTPMPPWKQFINETQARWLAQQLKKGRNP